MGNKLDGNPKLYIGSYLNCNAKSQEMEADIQKMERRINEGVSFFLTPPVFDLITFEDFINKTKHFKTPIIAGLILLKSVATARYLNKHVDDTEVPDKIIDRLYSAGDKQKESIAITAELINGLKELCQGINIMAMGWETKIPSYLDAAKI